jgi:MoxR-like ATPase
MKDLNYKGDKKPKDGELNEFGQTRYQYLPSPDLVEAVNLAIQLKRPLILKGEPGCGKTQLAKDVAYELDLPLETWNIKSTSRARDGLYTYDSVARLRDAQLMSSSRNLLTDKQMISALDPKTYRKFGPLGKAFLNHRRTVLLIDEIDKADIDFPNDLLLELDEKRFVIDETGENIVANPERPPIIFITSNDEKDLPDAFLRRCLFHYIEFPDESRLKDIINAHFSNPAPELVDKAVSKFMNLREQLHKERINAGKNVSTSELIDWFKVLHEHPNNEIIKDLDGKLPFLGVLIKNWTDHQRYVAKFSKEKI